MIKLQLLEKNNVQNWEKRQHLWEPVKNHLADFFRLGGGGVPPNSAKSFWAEWFSVKGGRGVSLNSAMENSAKKQVF